MTKQEPQIAQPMGKEVLTVSELSAYTGYKRSYIYKLICLRKLPHFKPAYGRRVFFNIHDINEFMLSQKQATVTEIISKI